MSEHVRGALFEYLGEVAEERQITFDDAQRRAASRLQELTDALAAFKAARGSALKRLFNAPVPPKGLYLWGGVGRGKSFLMDAFYAVVPTRRKTRMHFHPFMREVHRELAALKQEADPLLIVARRWAKRYRLICFDEFHVSDIADAMILGRLLNAMLDAGVVFVMTSNYRPDELWKDGLQRERFLPAIEEIKARMAVAEVDVGVDYRLRALQQLPTYLTPLSPENETNLAATFDRVKSGSDESPLLQIENREIHAKRRAGGEVWFDFHNLCETARSQNDYLEIARSFNTVLLSGVPRMTPAMASAARRFTWLVDVFYDHRVKLIISAEVPADELYTEGTMAFEFTRTASRLIEMQSEEYMSQPHSTL
jgi:cell division protein ZapE